MNKHIQELVEYIRCHYSGYISDDDDFSTNASATLAIRYVLDQMHRDIKYYEEAR
jgi:hypothetical protein